MRKSSSTVFVSIMCESESIVEIVNQLDEMEIVRETTLLDGTPKIIVKSESLDFAHIRDAIRLKIRKMGVIKPTFTQIGDLT